LGWYSVILVDSAATALAQRRCVRPFLDGIQLKPIVTLKWWSVSRILVTRTAIPRWLKEVVMPANVPVVDRPGDLADVEMKWRLSA
jgi:hypothetical protein